MIDSLDFAYISILLTLAACFGILANKLRQPPLLGYILAGVVINLFQIIPSDSFHQIELFSKIGIVFLLFILGMELDLRELRKMGKVVVITALGQIVVTVFLGYLISVIQGFTSVSSIFIAVALTFSSTIIVVKLLASKKELSSLHGKIAIGFLLVQDFAAILILIGLSAIGTGGSEVGILMTTLSIIIKIIILIVILYLFSQFVIPWIIKQTGHEREVLFISMVSWALFFATLVSLPIFAFSIEIGALCAGIALSVQKENLQIESWTRPLRDFFLTVFFVTLGLHIHIENVQNIIIPTLIFSFFVLIGNPIIVMVLLGSLGYNKRIGFFTSLTVAQISEFSLLLAAIAANMKFLDTNGLTIITLVGGITMAGSSYMITHKEKLYKHLKGFLSYFEFKGVTQKAKYTKQLKNHIVLFGFHRMGSDLEEIIKANKSKFLIVDHDPIVVGHLSKFKYKVVFGDMFDIDLYEKLNIEDAAMVISTVPDYNANSTLLKYLQQTAFSGVIITTAQSDQNVFDYYNQGSSYVVYPHLIAGQKLSKMVNAQLESLDEDKQQDIKTYISKLAKKQLPILNKRMEKN